MARTVQALSHITKALNQTQNNITQNHKILFFQIIKTQWDRDRRFLKIDIRKDIAATLQNVYNNVMLEWC